MKLRRKHVITCTASNYFIIIFFTFYCHQVLKTEFNNEILYIKKVRKSSFITQVRILATTELFVNNHFVILELLGAVLLFEAM
jgi:hypothetical protein